MYESRNGCVVPSYNSSTILSYHDCSFCTRFDPDTKVVNTAVHGCSPEVMCVSNGIKVLTRSPM